MTDKEAIKRYNYSLVRVSDRDDLRWMKAILCQMRADRQLTSDEYEKLFVSLDEN